MFCIFEYAITILCLHTIQSKRFLLYTGFTSNLEARIERHNSGGNKSTTNRRPLILIFSEFYLFEEDAKKRELYLKTSMGKKAIRLMLKTSLEKLGHKTMSLKSLQILNDLNRKWLQSKVFALCLLVRNKQRS